MRHHHKFKLRRVLLLMRVFSIVLLVFICAAILAWLFVPSTTAPPFWALLLLTGFSFYWLFIIQINTWNSSRGFNKRPDANSEIEWEFSVNEIKTRSELGAGIVAWKNFTKVIAAKDGFLFYPLKNLFYWIPFEAFDDPSCVERITSQIRQNAIPLLGPRSNKRLRRTRR